MEQLDGPGRWQLFEGHLRQFTEHRPTNDRIREALEWAIADFGLVATSSGFAGLSNTVRSNHPYSGGQWAWRWIARTDAGSGLALAMICDSKSLAIAANLGFEAKPALEAVADLDYSPERDYDGTIKGYTLVRPVGPREDATRQDARTAMAAILELAIIGDTITIPDNPAGL